ncbi:MAG: hypothetical protein ACLFN8_04750, partial [Candidatus Woesearchaeota archaeon]
MNLRYALNAALNFDEKEATKIIIISALSGFILSFRKWGTEQFNASAGLTNLVSFSIMFLILFFIFIYTQKVTAQLMGLDAKLHIWKYGPPIGVLVTIMSYGLIPFVFTGGVKLTEIPRLRLGKFKKTTINIQEMLIIGLTGPLALIFLSLLVLFPLYQISNNNIFLDMIWIVSIILLVCAIPLPSLNGLNLLLKYRSAWLIYTLFALLLYVLFALLKNPWIYSFSLILAILFAWLIKLSVKDKYL